MLNLMSLKTVKIFLGIADNMYDVKLSVMIPIISSDVRRILNDEFSKKIHCVMESGSNKCKITQYDYEENPFIKHIYEPISFDMGRVLYSPDLPDDTYVTSYDADIDEYTLSVSATGDISYVYPQLSISQWSAFSRMVFYKVGTMNPVKTGDKVQSKSMGPVSVSYSLNMNKKYNYPQELIDDLGMPRLKTC